VFQSVNARAVRQAGSVYGSTFVQLVAAAAALWALSLATQDLGPLARVPAPALALFAAAGLCHFVVGWTLLNHSQARIGAARTSPLLATTPVWGLVIAIPVAGQTPSLAALTGVSIAVAGAWLVGGRGPGQPSPGRSARC
jgi:drug/metabolite transporter (DMT)-like permease